MQDILSGLERIAEDLDAQQYPGQAWPAASRPVSRHRIWWAAGVVAAVAATVAVLVHVFDAPPGHDASAPPSENLVVDKPTTSPEDIPEEVTMPAILVVEDDDSYSFIDLMSDVPLVTFAKKDTYMPDCVVPLLPDAVMQPASEEDM